MINALVLVCIFLLEVHDSQSMNVLNFATCGGYKWIPVTVGKRYITVGEEQVTRNKASSRCQETGGSLLTIENSNMTKFLRDYFLLPMDRYWIGLRASNLSEFFKWDSGKTLNETGYENWRKESAGKLSDKYGGCVAMGSDSQWIANSPCFDFGPFICEAEVPCSTLPTLEIDAQTQIFVNADFVYFQEQTMTLKCVSKSHSYADWVSSFNLICMDSKRAGVTKVEMTFLMTRNHSGTRCWCVTNLKGGSSERSYVDLKFMDIPDIQNISKTPSNQATPVWEPAYRAGADNISKGQEKEFQGGSSYSTFVIMIIVGIILMMSLTLNAILLRGSLGYQESSYTSEPKIEIFRKHVHKEESPVDETAV